MYILSVLQVALIDIIVPVGVRIGYTCLAGIGREEVSDTINLRTLQLLYIYGERETLLGTKPLRAQALVLNEQCLSLDGLPRCGRSGRPSGQSYGATLVCVGRVRLAINVHHDLEGLALAKCSLIYRYGEGRLLLTCVERYGRRYINALRTLALQSCGCSLVIVNTCKLNLETIGQLLHRYGHCRSGEVCLLSLGKLRGLILALLLTRCEKCYESKCRCKIF